MEGGGFTHGSMQMCVLITLRRELLLLRAGLPAAGRPLIARLHGSPGEHIVVVSAVFVVVPFVFDI